MITIEQAYKLRTIIESAMSNVDDKTASEAADLFPKLKEDGQLVQVGTRINWNGTVKRAAVDLWDTAENNPDNATDLWEDIEYRDGYRIILETITVGTAFAKDECGWWKDGHLYKSLYDANVHTPEQYPNGWELVQ